MTFIDENKYYHAVNLSIDQLKEQYRNEAMSLMKKIGKDFMEGKPNNEDDQEAYFEAMGKYKALCELQSKVQENCMQFMDDIFRG